jgi:hypothetical protein
MHGYLMARVFSLFPFQYSTQSSRDDDAAHVTPMANMRVEMKGHRASDESSQTEML